MHFLLYVVDSLRADHLSCYGYDRETTPNLDDLADDGVRFNSCISPSTWTAPVAASLVSGWYPPAHGQERRGDVLPSSLPMIQEKFQAAGFETVLVTGMGHVSAATGYDRGFDEIVETYKQDSIIDKRTRSTTEQEQLYLEDAEIIAYPRAEDLNDQLMQWLAERESEDTFALVWAIDPHDPYDPPADAERFLSDAGRFGDLGRTRESAGNANTSQEFEHVKDLYDCEIRYWDQEFGSLIERIKQRGLYDDTTVAVLGDHGEAFGEQTWVDFPGYSRPLRSHGNPPFGNQVHVPLILKAPQHPAGAVQEKLVSLIDVPPTLLDIAGVEGFEMQGKSLFGGSSRRNAAFSRTFMNQMVYQGVHTDEFRYIDIQRDKIRVNALRNEFVTTLQAFVAHHLLPNERLYERDGSRADSSNIAKERPEVLSKCRELVEDWLSDCRQYNAGEIDSITDKQTRRQLEALGYKE